MAALPHKHQGLVTLSWGRSHTRPQTISLVCLLAKVLDLLEVALVGDRVEDPALEAALLGTLCLQDDPHVCL